MIQWIDDKIEVVHVDASVYNALADAITDYQHESDQCLLEKDLLGYNFLSITKNGFVPMFVQLTFETRLGDIVFQ
jgi:hypothetical protein